MGSERGWGISPTHPRLTHSLEKRIRISFSQFARDHAERFRKQAAASPGRSLLIAAIESSEKAQCGATESDSENGEVREFSFVRTGPSSRLARRVAGICYNSGVPRHQVEANECRIGDIMKRRTS
jgi:hypothetical protein